MPNKSIYDVYFGAGEAAGEYESSLRGVSDVWGDIEQSQKMGALKTQRRERGLDTLLAGTELISQVAGGLESKKEFKSALARVGGSMGEDIVGQKVGKGGEAWGDISGFKRLFQKPQWQFGDTATMGREDISIASEMIKYGGKPDYTRFKPKSAAEEVNLQGESARKAHYQSESDRFASMEADSAKMESEFERRKARGGKFYGERTGFDIGDIFGEKSIFAAGKQKLSSAFSPKKPSQVGGAPKTDDLAEKQKSVHEQNKQRREAEKLRKAKASERKEPAREGLTQQAENVADVVTKIDRGKDVSATAAPVISPIEKIGSGSYLDQLMGFGGSMYDIATGALGLNKKSSYP